MEYRTLGKTGYRVSTIGFGAWAIGGSWGTVDDDTSLAALRTAVESGINFIDTADVYGDGRSERLVAALRRDYPGEQIFIATKAGRRLDPHVADGYNEQNLNTFVDRSLANLETETIDLLQLHCPPPEVYYRPEVFEALDRMVEAGKIRHYGVSVEKVEEGLKAIEYPGVATVQIIFNMFRLRPAERFFPLAQARNVGIIARVPLASGLLSGKMTRETTFEPTDHRRFNIRGEAFDVGETFSGVEYETGLEAVDELRSLVPEGATMAQTALRWIVMFPAVTTAIAGAKNPDQAAANAAAADLAPLPTRAMKTVEAVYDRLIRPQVHQRW